MNKHRRTKLRIAQDALIDHLHSDDMLTKEERLEVKQRSKALRYLEKHGHAPGEHLPKTGRVFTQGDYLLGVENSRKFRTEFMKTIDRGKAVKARLANSVLPILTTTDEDPTPRLNPMSRKNLIKRELNRKITDDYFLFLDKALRPTTKKSTSVSDFSLIYRVARERGITFINEEHIGTLPTVFRPTQPFANTLAEPTTQPEPPNPSHNIP